jgi:hypothetical protein
MGCGDGENEMKTVSEICRETGSQDCQHCEDFNCGDNTNRARLKRHELVAVIDDGECSLWVEYDGEQVAEIPFPAEWEGLRASDIAKRGFRVEIA